MISIIIPVYNVKPYLERCIQSVKDQTFTDWECIIVNDGSTDGCDEELSRLTQNDDRFLVVHQENHGLALARNTGLLYAGGRFIFFLDSDDWLSTDALSVLYNEHLNHPEAGRIFGRHYVYMPNGHDYPTEIALSGLVLSNDSRIFSNHNSCYLGSCDGCLYVLDNIPCKLAFPDVMLVEDFLFNVRLMFAGMSTYVSDRYIYHYTIREGSLVTRTPKKHEMETAVRTYNQFVEQFSPSKEMRDRIYKCLLESYTFFTLDFDLPTE